MDYIKAIEEFITREGSYRAAAEKLGVDHAYLWRLCKGRKKNPSDEVLAKLGIERRTRYVRVKR